MQCNTIIQLIRLLTYVNLENELFFSTEISILQFKFSLLYTFFVLTIDKSFKWFRQLAAMLLL